MISGSFHDCFVFCIAGLPFGCYFLVWRVRFEGSFSRGKASRKHSLPVFLAFSVLTLLCMSGDDTKRIAEYYFGCAS